MGAGLAAPAVEAAERSAAPYELVVWDFNSPVGAPTWGHWYDWMKKTFEAENPEIKVNFQWVPFGDPFIEKLQASVAAGNPPDVTHLSVAWARDLWDRHVLYQLNDLVSMTPQLQPKNFFPAAAITESENGAIFGVPMEGPDSICIDMNVDLIAKTTGWPASTPQDLWTWPDRVKTWDDFNKLAVALTKRSGSKVQVAGFDVPDLGADLDFIAAVMPSNGTHFYKNNLANVNFTSPRTLECVQWILDLQNKYKVSTPPNANMNYYTELVTGRAAMIYDGTYGISNLHDMEPKFRVMVMPIPRGPHGTTKGSITWMNVAAMPRNARNVAASWKFIKFRAGLQCQLKGLEYAAEYAPLRSFYSTPQWKAGLLQHPGLAMVPVIAQLGDIRDYYHHSELQDKVGPILSEIALGKVTPQAGLAKAQQVGDAILSGV
jgi:ABC-type glycerol-3-phosphate transport system substrate-binding protein